MKFRDVQPILIKVGLIIALISSVLVVIAQKLALAEHMMSNDHKNDE